MKLVVGLGNPGAEYENSRHNVGFRVLDKLAAKQGWQWNERRAGRTPIWLVGRCRAAGGWSASMNGYE